MKNFILKTVDELGIEKNIILGSSYSKIVLEPDKTYPDWIVNSILNKFGKEFLLCDDINFLPFTNLFIVDEDNEFYEINSEQVKQAYITCNGTTVERLKVPKDFEDYNVFEDFWSRFFSVNKY